MKKLSEWEKQNLIAFGRLHPEAQAIPGVGFLAVSRSFDNRTGRMLCYNVAQFTAHGMMIGYVAQGIEMEAEAHRRLRDETIKMLIARRDNLSVKAGDYEAITQRLEELGVGKEIGLAEAVPETL